MTEAQYGAPKKGGVDVFRYKVKLGNRAASDESRELEVISSTETGAIAIALKLVDDLHGKTFYPEGVTFLSKL